MLNTVEKLYETTFIGILLFIAYMARDIMNMFCFGITTDVYRPSNE